LQQSTQIDLQIARVVAQCFFGGPLAQSAGLKMMEQSFAEIDEQPLEPPADGGFVDMEDAGDLGEGLPIEEIRGEQVALFRGKALKRAGNSSGQAYEFCCNRSGLRLRRGSVESIEWRLAVRSPVMIDMTLGERRAKPAE
jgi:hypothetical protein